RITFRSTSGRWSNWTTAGSLLPRIDLSVRRKATREDAIADAAPQHLIDDKHRAGEPRQQLLAAAIDDEAHDAVDAFFDGPDAKRRRRRLGPRLAVGAQDVLPQRRVHERRRY